jgi:hypothetical protein
MSPWKGWALGETALYIDQPPGAQYVGLFMQFEDEVEQLGAFSTPDCAMKVQAWLEHALTMVGSANAELVTRLQELERG